MYKNLAQNRLLVRYRQNILPLFLEEEHFVILRKKDKVSAEIRHPS